MTQEQKELLLKDLCARLPYGVIVETPKGKGHICDINLTIFESEVGVNINPTNRDKFNIEDIKPYLFPLSSMTEEQLLELVSISFENSIDSSIKTLDWCYRNHIDIRGLIPLGLANDATELNIY